jgi:hypothetical protein
MPLVGAGILPMDGKPDPPDNPPNVTITSPKAGDVITGGQPGAPITIVGTGSPAGSSVYVTVDGIMYYEKMASSETNWSIPARVYNNGPYTIAAGITDRFGDSAASSPVTFTANLTYPDPQYQITGPLPTDAVPVPLGGQDVTVEVTCDDQFGPRTFTVTVPPPAAGAPAPVLAPKTGVPGTYTGTAHLPANDIGPTVGLTVECREPAGPVGTQSVTFTGVDITPPQSSLNPPHRVWVWSGTPPRMR